MNDQTHPIDGDNPIEADKPKDLLAEAIQEVNAAVLEELQEEEAPKECRITIAGTLYVIDLEKLLKQLQDDNPMEADVYEGWGE